MKRASTALSPGWTKSVLTLALKFCPRIRIGTACEARPRSGVTASGRGPSAAGFRQPEAATAAATPSARPIDTLLRRIPAPFAKTAATPSVYA